MSTRIKPPWTQEEVRAAARKNCPLCGRFTKLIEEKEILVRIACEYCSWSEPPPFAAKKSAIEKVLPQTVRELLQAVPTNPIVRTQVHALTRIPLPDDLVNYEDIKEWVEWYIPPRNMNPETSAAEIGGGGPGEAFRIPCQYSETESGRCNYSRRMTGSTDYGFSADELLTLARDANNTRGLTQAVYGRLIDIVKEGPPETNQDGGEETDEHDCDNTENQEVRINRARLEAAIRTWLGGYHPELLQRLDGVGLVDVGVFYPAQQAQQAAGQNLITNLPGQTIRDIFRDAARTPATGPDREPAF